MKIYRKCLVIGLMILFVGASVGASVVPNINGDKDKVNSVILSNENKPGQINRAWSDNFDSYSLYQYLDGTPDDGGWECWDEDPAVGAYVTNNQSRSSPHSVEIAWFSGVAADIIHQFSDINSGTWILTAWQYVPGDMGGISMFILLNTYTHGSHVLADWSLQLEFSSTGGYIRDFDNPSATLPLITDEWVPLVVKIDFEADIQTAYYGGEYLLSKSWTAGVSPGGAKNLACVDLYAGPNPTTSVYYDDLSLDVPQPLSCDADGPYEGIVDEEIEFDGTATGGIPSYQYLWDFGDGNTSDEQNPIHTYANAGNYTVILTVTDGEDNTASDTTWALINGPPGAPTIAGETNGHTGTEYDYTFNAVDPDGDTVRYHIDWGDTNTNVTGFNPSGTDVIVPHTWTTQDTFTITAYAEDDTGLTGPSNTLVVTMPRAKAVQTSLFLRILENHPNLFPILRQLLGL